MWRDTQTKNRSEKGKVNNNRWLLVVAVIFLLMGSLVYKLFKVQINQFDLYTVMASSQHQVFSQLVPERGKIFFSEKNGQAEKLYLLATNKEFAEVYLVPKDIVNPEVMAEKLYNFFDEPQLKDKLKKEDPNNSNLVIATSTKLELISNYLRKLDKPDDPYEPLKAKLSPDDLIKLYSYLSSADYNSTSTTPLAQPDELMLKSEKVVYKNDNTEVFKVAGLGFSLQ